MHQKANQPASQAMPFEIIDKQDRTKLSEGRNYGLGFAFCKRDGNILTTVQPLSPCRDFLNDVVYSEATGKDFHVYGLDTSRKDCWLDGNAYLLMSILPYNRTTKTHAKHNQWVEVLDSLGPIPSFLSHFEKAMGVPVSIWEKNASNRVLAILPKFWVEATYRISLWTLLARVALDYKGGDHMAFLKACTNEDMYFVKAAVTKLEHMIAGEIPAQDLTKLYDVHNCGIVAFKFPDKQSAT